MDALAHCQAPARRAIPDPDNRLASVRKASVVLGPRVTRWADPNAGMSSAAAPHISATPHYQPLNFVCNVATHTADIRGSDGSDSDTGSLLDAIETLPKEGTENPFTADWESVMEEVDLETMVAGDRFTTHATREAKPKRVELRVGGTTGLSALGPCIGPEHVIRGSHGHFAGKTDGHEAGKEAGVA
eukprot:31577-Rhodomonas_salina.2